MEKTKILIDNITTGLTFDDVLMIPQHSNITSRSDCNTMTRISKNVKLNLPFVSSPMDTVTESEMAIEMARLGGIGIIHRFNSINEQASMIAKVKRSETHFITDPIILFKDSTISDAKRYTEEMGINTFIIVDRCEKTDKLSNRDCFVPKRKNSKTQESLLGILTHRDVKFSKSDSDKVTNYMTSREKLVVYEIRDGETPCSVEIKNLMLEKRVEKIPVVNFQNQVQGLVTLKDLSFRSTLPNVNVDQYGSLIVGASVGAAGDYLERAEALIHEGVDVLVVDIANGHSDLCINTVKELKASFPKIDVVAGSVATGEGARALIKAGADGIRCGIGNGSICITRIVSGCGVPQLTALFDVAPVCHEYDIPLISDGGNRNSGNMCKALASGASCVMLGRLVAGTEESPSKIIYREGKLSKVYRGMAGYGANVSKAVKTGGKEVNSTSFTPEGVEGVIPYAGPLKDVLNQFIMGIKSGMSYNGAHNIVELWKNHEFIRITASGKHESGVHDIKQV